MRYYVFVKSSFKHTREECESKRPMCFRCLLLLYGLPKEGVCCACDPNERLDAPFICSVYVFVCRSLSSHLGV